MPARDLEPGTKVRYKPNGEIQTLARRKDPQEHDYSRGVPWFPGWWVEARCSAARPVLPPRADTGEDSCEHDGS